jgi:hypothetical protein
MLFLISRPLLLLDTLSFQIQCPEPAAKWFLKELWVPNVPIDSMTPSLLAYKWQDACKMLSMMVPDAGGNIATRLES